MLVAACRPEPVLLLLRFGPPPSGPRADRGRDDAGVFRAERIREGMVRSSSGQAMPITSWTPATILEP